MNKTFLCFMCRFAEMQIEEVYVPLYATSKDVKKVEKLVFWCNHRKRYMNKFSVKPSCGYKPRAGQIGKHLWQMELV